MTHAGGAGPRPPGPEPTPAGPPAPPGGRAAGRLTRLLLRLLYPPSFRRELGAELLADVERRAAERAAAGSRLRATLWLVRLAASLVANGLAAWLDDARSGSRRTRTRRALGHRIVGARGSPLHDGPDGRSPRLSWLDVKLGLRMLRKHPVLSLAGGFGIAVAIGVSTGFFAFGYAWVYPTIPLEDGDRLVALRLWDIERNREESRALHDFTIWREEMRSVEELSAYREVTRNLITGDASPEPIGIAEMTPSGFELARVPPYLGRTLVAGDADPGAPDVLVIGHDVWRTRFAGDPDIVGRDVRLGRDAHTVVGVMPAGFAFPVDHDYWIPLREGEAGDTPRGTGPAIYVFGRLAPGSTLDDAGAELALLVERAAANTLERGTGPTAGESGAGPPRVRAQVMPYAQPWSLLRGSTAKVLLEFALVNSFTVLLLVVVGLNVAVLVYARTVTRLGEIAVRTALGASRGRIVAQLFAESLVLASGAAAVGVGLAKLGLRVGNEIQTMEVGGSAPFWFELAIPGPALAYALALTVLTAALTGVVPALRATSERVQDNLRRYRGGGMRLGRTWTALIVVQVAVTVAALPIGIAFGWGEVTRLTSPPTYPVDRFLVVWAFPDEEGLPPAGSGADAVAPDGSRPASDTPAVRPTRLADVRGELARRLEAVPGVVSHAPMPSFPNRGTAGHVTLEGAADSLGYQAAPRVQSVPLHPDAFGPLQIEVLAGRPLLPADLAEGAAHVAVVDRRFVTQVLAGGDALGRRMRFARWGGTPEAEDGEPWLEIVGVVENLHASRGDDALVRPNVYVTLRPRPEEPVATLVEYAGVDAASLSGQVRAIAADLDPTLRIATHPLRDAYRMDELTLRMTALLVGGGALTVLLLSAAGIYALMSVTVTQRRREIGIRTALGAQRARLLGGIFGRALAQLGVGVGLGLTVALGWDLVAGGRALGGHGGLLLPAVVAVMTGVGALSALGPARRGLAVAPAEALGTE